MLKNLFFLLQLLQIFIPISVGTKRMSIRRQRNEIGVGQRVLKLNYQQGNPYLDQYHRNVTMQAAIQENHQVDVTVAEAEKIETTAAVMRKIVKQRIVIRSEGENQMTEGYR